jgi:putative flippase GtrA
MNNYLKRDLWISLVIGIVAGLLFLPTLGNIGFSLDAERIIAVILALAIITPAGYAFAYWLSRWFPVMVQFIKFSIVGGLNFLIDLGVLNFLIYLSGISAGIFYSAFKGTSFAVAVINSYFWNKYWTFESSGSPKTAEFFTFLAVNLIGFAINVTTASLVVNFIGAPPGFSGSLWANVGAAIAAIVSLFWNFIGMKYWVFRK